MKRPPLLDAKRRALEFFGLVLNSGTALKALARLYSAEMESDEEAAAVRVAEQRALVRRRAITACFAAIAVGLLLNNSAKRSLTHDVAGFLIYAGLFVLSSQFSDRWPLRPGAVAKRFFRR
jgi:hypothetical protein